MSMTRRGLETLKQGQTLWDGKVKGFGARRQSENGAISLFLMARLKGRKRRISIGRLGQPWTVETARNEAVKMLGQLASGVDPSTNVLEERQTLNELAEQWLSHHVEHELKERTRQSYTANVRLYMEKKIGRLPIASVDHAAVQLWHDSMRETPRAANYALATLSSMWSWALQRGLISHNNPCQNVKRFPENKRTRFVTLDEVARLFSALGVEAGKSPYGVAAIKLMLFTGARQSEILTARWEGISGDYLRLEDSKTGSRKIYLTPQASEVLANIPRQANNPFVICGAKAGAYLVNIKDLWKRVITAAGIEDCRIHDLRHSYASFAVSSGSTLAEIGGQLGHRSAQTTSRYAHLFDDPVGRSAENAARFIEQAAGLNDAADQPAMAEKKETSLPPEASGKIMTDRRRG